MQHVLRRLVDDGFAVHVYVSLIFDASGTGNWFASTRSIGREDPSIEHLSRRELQLHVHDLVQATGACLVCAEVPQRPQTVPHIPVNAGQLSQFPPHRTRTGKRLLNMWLRRERMWNATLQRERALGERYEFLMWVRDDALWVADMARPSVLLRTPRAASTLWTRRCGAWGGLNDKVAMFGRAAAPTLLTLYSGFMHGGLPARTKNSEAYILEAAARGRVVLERTGFEVQPSVEAMVYDGRRGPALCVMEKYWCGGDRGRYGLAAEFCEDVARSRSLPRFGERRQLRGGR